MVQLAFVQFKEDDMTAVECTVNAGFIPVVHGDGVLDSAEVRNHLENILLSLSFQDSLGYYCMTLMQRSGNLKLVSSSSLTGFGLHGFGR
jgi:hypothetical protein